MKIVQLLPTLAYGDAIGNHVLALYKLLQSMGYATAIYAEAIDSRIDPALAAHYTEMPSLQEDDIIIYHFSIGSEIMEKILRQQPAFKIMIYHNITPGYYFSPYNATVERNVQAGRQSLYQLRDLFPVCWADSEYNRQDLIREGYTCPIYVIPILIPFSDYDKAPEQKILQQYSGDGVTNFLFVGRVAPNKMQEDVILAFSIYRKKYNKKARLFIVGNYDGMELYYERLLAYAAALDVEEHVIFTGHTPFSHILAYYRLADVFLCMSNHEGVCVPLFEAMKFQVPIVAFSAAAVPETLGGSGVLVHERDGEEAAKAIHHILQDEALREDMIHKGMRRIEALSYDNIADIVVEHLQRAIKIRDNKGENTRTFERYTKNPQEKMNAERLAKYEGTKTIKQRIKYGILKPSYLYLHRFSPKAAMYIRHGIYAAYHAVFASAAAVKQEIPLLAVPTMERTAAALLIDTTKTTQEDVGTGIQRVVNCVFAGIYKNRANIIAVKNVCGSLETSNEYKARFSVREEHGGNERVPFVSGDCLFLLDSSWEYYSDFSKILTEAKKKGVKIYAVIYDLIPLKYPEYVASQEFTRRFKCWHDMVLEYADGILCISRTIADEVSRYFATLPIKRQEPLEIYPFRMGADISKGVAKAREKIKAFVAQKNTFLMVGTIEPRKGHLTALMAMQEMSHKKDVNLLILGRQGWKNEEILSFMEAPDIKDRILWVQDASDEELRWAYQNCTALIAASRDEGYGLPIIEAAHYGLPIICSDIPIFHEVTQGHADYFTALDAAALANTLDRWLEEKNHPDSRQIQIYTWEEAAKEIISIIDGGEKPYKTFGQREQ